MSFTARQKYVTIAAVVAVFLAAIHFFSPVNSSKWSIPKISYLKPINKTSVTTLNNTLSTHPGPNAMTLDVIISIFRESLDETAEALADVRAVASRLHLKYERVRVFVYVKDEHANGHEIQKALGTDLVRIIPNRGRESGTFLNHIINNWNDLSHHNMFIQAHMHHRPSALNKMSDYLIPSTGYLNLGIFEVCDCISCSDPWDGSRIFSRLPQIYTLINQEFCPQRIALGYLAQFIVSRKRISGTLLSTYEYIRDVAESDMSHFIHTDPHQGQFEDTITNPYFGHTIERSYGLLFGCHNATMASDCGTGFGAMDVRRAPGDSDQKCQCLDS